MPSMGVDFSFFALIVLALVGLLLLGGLVAIIALLINPKTRVVGLVLLAIVVLAVVMVGAAAFLHMFDGRMVMGCEQVGQLIYLAG
jgi:hypothetical protein